MKLGELVNVIPDGQVIKIRDIIRDKTLFFDDRGFLSSDSHINEKEVLSVISSIGAYDSSEDEWELIYCRLGNAVNDKLSIEFINSNYNLNLLKDKSE